MNFLGSFYKFQCNGRVTYSFFQNIALFFIDSLIFQTILLDLLLEILPVLLKEILMKCMIFALELLLWSLPMRLSCKLRHML